MFYFKLTKQSFKAKNKRLDGSNEKLAENDSSGERKSQFRNRRLDFIKEEDVF